MSEPQIRVVADAATLAERVHTLAHELEESLRNEDPLLLGILWGSEVFLSDLIRALDFPVRYEFLRVEYATEGEEQTVTAIHFPIPVDVRNQNVVVVKGVVASGITEAYLGAQLRDRGAASVRFVALADLADERKTYFAPDFRALMLHRAGRLVGYGLKGDDGRLGSLPYLGEIPRT